MYLPSVGDEVVVSFEDGDPDRPLITGRVYNPQRPVPKEHPLPASKYHAVIARDSMGNDIYMDGSKNPGIAIGGSSSSSDDKTRAAILVGFGAGLNAFSEQSCNWLTAGSKFEINGGATFEAFVGGSCDVFVGDKSEVTGGISRELFLGDQSSFLVGSTYECCLASKIALSIDSYLEFNLGGGVNVTCAKEVAYNTFDTGMMSAKGLTFLAGLTDRASLDMNPLGLELRFGQPMGVSQYMPTIAAVTAGVVTGAMGVVNGLGAVVPAVSSGYAAVMQAGAGILDVGTSAGAEGGAEGGGVTKGTEDYPGWGASTAKEVSHAVEGFVSGSVLGAVGVAEGGVMAVANLAVSLAALIALKSCEEKPPEKLSAGMRLSAKGALLLGMPPGGQLPATAELEKENSASYVELSYNAAIASPNMVQLCAAGSVQIGTDFCSQTTPAINIGTSSATVAIKGSSITGNNSSLLVQ
jgi:hypothetical protein